MNSLTYLSRQFDVLASAKTPPSTPSSEHPPRRGGESSLPRISTWSTKSFLFPLPSRHSPKRSFSSPSIAPVQHKSLPSLPTSPPSSSPSSPPSEPPPLCSKPPHLESVLRQIFFIRVFLLVWDNLKSAWASLAEQISALAWYRGNAAIETVPLLQEKGKGRAVECAVEETSPARLEHTSTQISPPLLQAYRSTTDPIISVTLSTSESPSSQLSSSSAVAQQSASSTPRSSTPVLNARKTPFHFPKTLVLDLDETLIHSTSRPIASAGGSGSGLFGLGPLSRRNKGAGHMVEVVLGGRSTLYHVYKRPFVDFFLRTVSGWYTLVIFTASMQEYADPVIDWLDAGRGILVHRLFRDSCTQLPNGSYTKDLSVIEADLSRVCLVDNSPISYKVNEANGIPIEGWTHDPSDEALLDLLPVLDSLRFTSDVRRVLGLRSAGVHS
ncbi:HAD-like domain-containing protein [Crucibulum laeve]|uniref:HAD-like domain-containing protein n=1 Tax=Crucibulum laeve TaxID=68775 RepID=A0A5C3MQR5_9AGAR|nr:HAD-like domain-containing protein [Crucibulum laeve]